MRVAITGGIAEGKSAVLAIVAARGFTVASADEVARQLFRDEEVNARVAAEVGLRAPITGAELRDVIARDPSRRRRVNGVLHPRIAAALRERGADFDEIPLLVETCRFGDYDRVWNVACSPEEKRRRLVARYGEDAPFAEIAAAQLPDRVRRAFADLTISTDGELSEVAAQVETALEALA